MNGLPRDSRVSGFAVNLSPPPAHADEQETPVVEKFRRLAFEGVADELENPSDEEQSQSIRPQAVVEDAGDKNWPREQDGRNAQRVTQPVHRMPMTGAVLRDPLLVSAMIVAASAQHAEDDITPLRRQRKTAGRDFSCQPYLVR
jgi:hypothetical protein